MKNQLRRVLAIALTCAVLPSFSVGQDQGNPKEAKEVLNTYVSVVSKIYPPAGGVFGAMLSALEFTGYFGNSPDPVAAALSAINTRLDEHQRQITKLSTELQDLRQGYFGERNWNRFSKLQASRNNLKTIAEKLADKPADKIGLAGDARTEAALFLDMEMWTWSDQSVKDQTWTNRQDRSRAFKAGEMTEPDFKAMPTLEYYTTALVVWMATIEHATGGNAAVVRDRYGVDLQAHIDFLSKRPGWKELGGEPLTLPEHVMDRVRGGYEPEKYPKQGVCHIWQYIRDDMRRNVEFANETITYAAVSNNELCNVPASRRNSAPQIERDREREYGLEVMANLAALLTSLKDKGTVRGSTTSSTKPSTTSQPTASTEPFTGRHSAVFENTVPFNTAVAPGDFNILYGVQQDGNLVWQRHIMTGPKQPTTPGAKPIKVTGNRRSLHSWNPPQVVGRGWAVGNKNVLPAGQQAIYVVKDNGELMRYWHSGAFDGSFTWGDAPQMVGTGWAGPLVVPSDDGVVYTITDDGILHWHRNPHFADSKGSPNLWANSVNVGRGWSGFKHVFSGGKGVIYVVNNENKLMWFRHKAYLNPTAMPEAGASDAQHVAWQNSWEGPKEVSTGWDGFTRIFSPGDGHIYGIAANGDLMWYRHLGWQNGTLVWDPNGGIKIAAGWDAYVFAFARLTGSDPSSNSGVY